MAYSSISLEGIDQAIIDLNYRQGSVKQKAITAIRSFYSSEESIKELDSINSDTLIKLIWDVGDNFSKIKSKRRNFSSLRSSINTDLKKLLKKDKNPDNIILADSNIFDLTQEAKEDLLGSFSDAFKKGNIDLDQAATLLETMTQFLDKIESKDKDVDSQDIADKIKKILDQITKNTLSEDGDGGTTDQKAAEKGEHNEEGEGEEIELDEDEEIEEIDDEEIEEVDEGEEIDDLDDDVADEIKIEIDDDEELEEVDELDENEELEEIEIDDERLDAAESQELGDDESQGDENLTPAGGIDEDLEEIELDEDEEIEEVDEKDDFEDIEEVDDDEELDEVEPLDDDVEEIELEDEEELDEIEFDEDEELEEIEIDSDEQLDKAEGQEIGGDGSQSDENLAQAGEIDEDLEEIELDEDEDIEEVDEEDDFEDIEEVDDGEELEEIESLDDDVEQIELDDDEELHEIDELDDDVEEIEIDDDEELEEVDELDEEELKALEEFREKRELSEQFDKTLGERERKYNRYTKVPEGLYTVGTKKGLKSTLELQQFDMPEVYMGIYPVINSLFEIFIEETGYITSAEKKGFGRVYYSRFKKGSKESTWNKNSGSKDVKGACWHQPTGPDSSLHGKRNHPVVQISVDDAFMFASWIGRRLPTETEWESAARTDLGYKYPWGNEFNPKALNLEQSGLSDTSSVDDYDAFANEFKIIDMLGNVMEWTSDMETPPFKSAKNIKYCVAKGAAWNARDDVTISSRTLFKPGFTSNTIGFRCISEIFL